MNQSSRAGGFKKGLSASFFVMLLTMSMFSSMVAPDSMALAGSQRTIFTAETLNANGRSGEIHQTIKWNVDNNTAVEARDGEYDFTPLGIPTVNVATRRATYPEAPLMSLAMECNVCVGCGACGDDKPGDDRRVDDTSVDNQAAGDMSADNQPADDISADDMPVAPGFGLAVAILALLGVTALLFRRTKTKHNI